MYKDPELKNLIAYEDWKSAKARRKTWMSVIALFLAIIFGYMAGNFLCKVGLNETKKVFSYSFGTDDKDLKPENQSKIKIIKTYEIQ